jgi:hypothetical protein
VANTLRTGVQRLADRMKANAGESVVYTRGNDSVTLTAVVGTTPFRQTDGAGRSTLAFSEADFLILAVDLRLAGMTVKPARGDKITWNGGTYEVNAPGGEPCYRNSDQFGIRLRVHTKKVV